MADTMDREVIPEDELTGLDPWTAAVRDELAASRSLLPTPWECGPVTVDVRAGRESLWIVARSGKGGTAFRTTYAPGAPLTVDEAEVGDGAARFALTTSLGRYKVEVERVEDGLLRWRSSLTPGDELRLPFWPRDIYPLGRGDDPRDARGTAHAGQPNSGAAVLFWTGTAPASGTMLYLQNLTALNPLLAALEAKPSGLVGGQWPQLGYAPPPSETPLKAGVEVTVSDALVVFSPQVPADERQAARLFLDGLARLYPHIAQTETRWHDWPRKARESAHDLAHADGCLVVQDGHTYARPYLDAEEPDSMVQLALLLPLREFEGWTGEPIPLADALRRGVPAFYDAKLKTMRRYLPSVGEEKDADEVDSWYLYHPLLDLARLAGTGDSEARRLFLDSLEHGIKAAHHFQYRWPVQFNVETFEVITGDRKPGEPGQSDVGGLYADVCLHAWGLTGKDRYLEEAKKAARALSGYRFAAGYQYNITAIGAAACLRLWRETGDDFFRDQAFVLLASFFHHTTLFESDLGAAKFFPTFLAVLCLHDAEYTAIFEAFESLAAFHEILSLTGDDLPPSVTLLLTEYCRHLLDRAWYYYPGEMPEEALATEIRNGHLDRALALPVEDLYANGDPAGAVGQEVYGAGAAFAFVTRAFHRLPRVPFLLYCDYPLAEMRHAEGCVGLRLPGVPRAACRLRLIPDDGRMPDTVVRLGGTELVGETTPEGHREYAIPGGGEVEIRWEEYVPG